MPANLVHIGELIAHLFKSILEAKSLWDFLKESLPPGAVVVIILCFMLLKLFSSNMKEWGKNQISLAERKSKQQQTTLDQSNTNYYSFDAIYIKQLHYYNNTIYAQVYQNCISKRLNLNKHDLQERIVFKAENPQTSRRTLYIISFIKYIHHDIENILSGKELLKNNNSHYAVIIFFSNIDKEGMPLLTEENITYGVNKRSLPNIIKIMSPRELFILATSNVSTTPQPAIKQKPLS